MAATSGPPKSAEIAEKDPAVETTARSRSPSRTPAAIASAVADPSAISGASGPSTAPNARLPIAARAMPGA